MYAGILGMKKAMETNELWRYVRNIHPGLLSPLRDYTRKKERSQGQRQAKFSLSGLPQTILIGVHLSWREPQDQAIGAQNGGMRFWNS